MTSEEMLGRLLHRDGLMLVVDKPAGIAVHKGPKGGESLEDYFDTLRFGLPRNPSLAHRLDRDTSGCLILGRHRKALEKLGLLFKQGKIGKTYWAVVEGNPEASEGLIDLPLATLEPGRGWWMKADPTGLPSQTRWRLRGRGMLAQRSIAWIECEPLTGRTHQIRVHLAAMGWPVLGDPIYGTARRVPDAPPLHLHSRSVAVPLPKSLPTRVTAAAPAHMRAALEACGWDGEHVDPAALAPLTAG